MQGRACVMLVSSSMTACSCPPKAQAGEPPTQAASAGGLQEKSMESPKRRAPSVTPVVGGGTRYEVLRGARSRGFAQNGGIVAAVDVASSKDGKQLLIKSENKKSYAVDLADRSMAILP
jgi:hypothetical protein